MALPLHNSIFYNGFKSVANIFTKPTALQLSSEAMVRTPTTILHYITYHILMPVTGSNPTLKKRSRNTRI